MMGHPRRPRSARGAIAGDCRRSHPALHHSTYQSRRAPRLFLRCSPLRPAEPSSALLPGPTSWTTRRRWPCRQCPARAGKGKPMGTVLLRCPPRNLRFSSAHRGMHQLTRLGAAPCSYHARWWAKTCHAKTWHQQKPRRAAPSRRATRRPSSPCQIAQSR